MFKGFSPRAQKIVSIYAQEEAHRNGSDQLLPEHVLLALLKTGDGLGYLTLRLLKINTISFQLALEQSLVCKSNRSFYSELPPSRRLKTMLDSAQIEARSLRQDYIGTEHILLAAIREESSISNIFFKKLDYSIEQVRRAVLSVIQNNLSSAKEGSFSSMNTKKSGSFFSPYGQIPSNGSQNPKKGDPLFGGGYSNKGNASLLKEHSRDLTLMARDGKLDPVIGREAEIARVVQILSRRNKNNPVLVGEPGVGKTAIVEGLAQRIVSENVPRNLLNKKILTLDLASVIAGTKYRGEFEERIKRIVKEIAENKDIILFIDELHTIIGAGGAEGAMDASNMLKPALSRGELQCIGATTNKEYRKYFEKDAALERRFQIVQIKEPSNQDTELILSGLKKQYEKYHGVTYADDVIENIVCYSGRYITERFFPDKAIDVLDEAGAMKKISCDVRPPELTELETRIAQLNDEKQQLVQNQNYERAAEVRDEVRELRHELDSIRKYWQTTEAAQAQIVTVSDVREVLSVMTGIPQDQIDTSETSKLVHMEEELHRYVIGQNEAVSLVTSAVRRSRAGVSSYKRPLGSFIFLGPTGVGKTLLAKTLARFMFGSEDSLIRIDMSDFMEKHNSSRLVGAPPGYVGYEEGGILTEKIRRNPYSVVLLDEIEKAHPDVFNLLLQVLEEGELKDNLGHTVNFRNTIIIMTSNAGVRQISNKNRLGFSSNEDEILDYEEIKSSALTELKKLLSPELINRIDDIVVFTALCRQEVSAILNIQLAELEERLAEKNLRLNVKPQAVSYLIENGYDPAMGARPMRRLLQHEIEDPLSIAIISGDVKPLSTVVVDFKKEKLTLSFKAETKTKKKSKKIELEDTQKKLTSVCQDSE